MRVSFDWSQIYSALLSQNSRQPKSALAAARRIENDIFEEGWPVGEVFGDQARLIHRYGFSRATLREAARLLEDRHVAQMRRGPGGGLIILPVPRTTIAPAVATYFHTAGIDADQIRQARSALGIIEAYREALAKGGDALRKFNQEFRSRLRQAPGTGVPGPYDWIFWFKTPHSADHVLTKLFIGCLDAIEDPTRAQNVVGLVDAFQPDSPGLPRIKEGLAHALARKLVIELHQVRAVGMSRLGSEDELCERHGVGREVLRQAIRVLESRGLIDIQRGRTHGLYAGASDSASLVEHVVAYLSSIHLTWRELEAFARMLTRIIRLVVIAESSPCRRQALGERLERITEWDNSPNLVMAHIFSEWTMVANPLLLFMEQCVVAYCARSSGAVWRSYDDSELSPLKQMRRYAAAAARGDLVQVDCAVDAACTRVDANRHGTHCPVGAEARALSA
ncbi:MAG TPA: GntR family transcriptional regulator [Steroidobacteraceae bacterium]|jgi:DNA-binding FadR family transcriptional regulator